MNWWEASVLLQNAAAIATSCALYFYTELIEQTSHATSVPGKEEFQPSLSITRYDYAPVFIRKEKGTRAMNIKFVFKAVLAISGSLILILAWSLLPAPVHAQTATAKTSQSPQATLCQQSAHGQNIMSLGDAQLKAFGLPSRTAIAQNPSRWSNIFSHLGQRDCSKATVVTPALHAASQAPFTGCNATPGSRCENYSWAGNETVSSNGQGDRGVYRDADVQFAVPTISTSVSNARSVYWTGVGGNGFVTSGGTVLVQAGVRSSVVNGRQFNLSWVEVWPNVQAYDLPLCRLNNGDSVYIYVESNLANSGYDYYFMENLSANGCYNSCTVHTNNTSVNDNCGFTGGSSFNSDSATGECIVERVNGQNGYPIAQFNPPGNTIQMQSCTVNSTSINDQSHNWLICENGSAQLMLGVGSINSSGTFPVTWYRGT
jgi:hypothetical protein